MTYYKRRFEEERKNISNDPEYQMALKNYNLWHEFATEEDYIKKGYINIFKNIDACEFCNMVKNADFSKLNKRGISQRVKYNISILSRLEGLGKEWGDRAAKKMGLTLDDCKKMTRLPEHDKLKMMYLQ